MANQPAAQRLIRFIQVAMVASLFAAVALSTQPWQPDWMSFLFFPGRVAWDIVAKFEPGYQFPSVSDMAAYVIATWLSFVAVAYLLWLLTWRVWWTLHQRGGAR